MNLLYECLACQTKFNVEGVDDEEIREFEFCPNCNDCNLKRIDKY